MEEEVFAKICVFGIVWILPCILTAVIGAKKKRNGLGCVLALIAFISGLLWVFLGAVLGWIGVIVVSCFNKNDGSQG